MRVVPWAAKSKGTSVSWHIANSATMDNTAHMLTSMTVVKPSDSLMAPHIPSGEFDTFSLILYI